MNLTAVLSVFGLASMEFMNFPPGRFHRGFSFERKGSKLKNSVPKTVGGCVC